MLKALLRRILERLDAWFLPLFSANRYLASLYYLANPRFHREHLGVVSGRVAFARREGGASDPMLRRNIHRLEKGLLMQPRHPTFAADYIGETVEAFLRAERSRTLDANEQRWAHDVLLRYFDEVVDTAEIAAARRRFDPAARSRPAQSWSPVASASRPSPAVPFEDFLKLCQRRRSIRWFLNQRVPQELIEQAVSAAAQAPSACNRQPFLYRLFTDPADAARIAAIPMGTTGYAEQVPALIVVLGDLSAFPHERDRHVPYIDASLATMQLMLALETLGLSSCPINWPDIEYLERRMQQVLELPPYIRPVMLLAIGYADPAGGVAFSAKKPVAHLLRSDNDYVD